MKPKAFYKSLAADDPPPDLPIALVALWYGGKGHWSRAHELVMGETGVDAAWVHAWLHREEGDLENANHWYRKSGRAPSSGTTEEEWREIAFELLTRGE